MPETEMFKWAMNLGPGLAFAVVILFWSRADRKMADDRYATDRKAAEDRYAADRKASEDRLASLAKDWREVVENNTRALTTMEVMLQRGITECPYLTGGKLIPHLPVA